MKIPLNQLFAQVDSDILIQDMSLDSRQMGQDYLFFAYPGLKQDGRHYFADVIQAGAAAIAYESDGATCFFKSLTPHECNKVIWIPIAGLKQQISSIASSFYGRPSQNIPVVGVTGTNGKTSVTYMLAQALHHLSGSCGLIGTLGAGFIGSLNDHASTTPDAVTTQKTLSHLRLAGAKAVAMEVSSHALDQDRVAGVEFQVAVLTNLTRDHLDYHGDMSRYGACKALLFTKHQTHGYVINGDDAFGRDLSEQLCHASTMKSAALPKVPMLLFGMENEAVDIYAFALKPKPKGCELMLRTHEGEFLVQTALLGHFNVSNLLAVMASLVMMKYPWKDILSLIPSLLPPPGRMQVIAADNFDSLDNQGPMVVVDFAHTPDALTQALTAIRMHTQQRLICVFGCGGERDRGKRPLMAKVAESLADVVIVTSDNSRSEKTDGIFAQIQAGFSNIDAIHFYENRADAIQQSILNAHNGDAVLIAGKGHETYQEVDGHQIEFSDQLYALRALERWKLSHA